MTRNGLFDWHDNIWQNLALDCSFMWHNFARWRFTCALSWGSPSSGHNLLRWIPALGDSDKIVLMTWDGIKEQRPTRLYSLYYPTPTIITHKCTLLYILTQAHHNRNRLKTTIPVRVRSILDSSGSDRQWWRHWHGENTPCDVLTLLLYATRSLCNFINFSRHQHWTIKKRAYHAKHQ